MTLCGLPKNLNRKRFSLSTFSLLANLTLVSPCSGTDFLPIDEMWMEISSHLDFKDQISLSKVSRAQQRVLRQREATIHYEFEKERKTNPCSALSEAYENLPEAWKTPKILFRLNEQAEEMGEFARGIPKFLLEFLCARGVGKALEKKISSLGYLNHSCRFYKVDIAAAKALIKKWSALGVWEAVAKQIEGIEDNKFDIKQDRATAKDLIDAWSALGVWEAKELMINGFAFGKYGYAHNPAKAKDLIEESLLKENWQAVKLKFIGLVNGEYGYDQNPSEAKDFLKDLIAKGVWQAQEIKIDGLVLGIYEYKKNIPKAKDLLELLIAKGVSRAIWKKLQLLVLGLYFPHSGSGAGYTGGLYALDRNEAKRFMEELIARGVKNAIKIDILAHIYCFYKPPFSFADYGPFFKYFGLPEIPVNLKDTP